MESDKCGRSTVLNLYFDTDSYLLIRRSMEKPAYKEKLRVRCYDRATPDSTVRTVGLRISDTKTSE